ncbi:MAG: RagB/SusD family nutrient uptake outer membrane protein [Flavobacteriaceae bacterium]|nr:RagB/SusD family nutrient uptake outer membrane protein [Flavobacteriaceae bacterium]
MKKNIYIILAGLLLFSCSEDLLNIEPTGKLSAKKVFENEETIDAVRSGMYLTLSDSYALYSFYLPILGDMLGNDMVYGGHAWNPMFLELYRYKVTQETSTVEEFFGKLFKVAEIVNTIDANITEEMAKKNPVQAQLKAEAKALRAMVNVDVARFFGKAYHLDNGDSKSIPYLNTLQYDPENPGVINKPFRNTMKEIYELAIKDFTDAYPNLPDGVGNVTFLNKNAVDALLSRIYLDMHDYEKAKKHAVEALKGIALMTTEDYKNGKLSRINSESVLVFEGDVNRSIGWKAHGYLCAFFDNDSNGSAEDFLVNKSLVASFKDSDIRKKFLTVNTNKGLSETEIYSYVTDYIEEGKQALGFKLAEQERGYMAYGKMPRGDSNISNGIKGTYGFGDYSYIRGAELILTIAECEARLGNDATAQAELYKIQKRADETAVQSTQTGEALIEEILQERRKELFGEGHAFRDILRLGKGLKREGSHPQEGKVVLTKDDSRFVFPLPRTAVEVNPNLAK